MQAFFYRKQHSEVTYTEGDEIKVFTQLVRNLQTYNDDAWKPQDMYTIQKHVTLYWGEIQEL